MPTHLNDNSEMLAAFAEEIAGVHRQLVEVVTALEKKQDQPALFERYGQVIDGIYGTAATLGFQELSEYARALKEVCYQCSQSDVPKGQQKVFNMCKTALDHLVALKNGLKNPAEVKRVRYLLHLEKSKAELLSRSVFFGIQRKSVAAK